jgi:hypothetical protein
MTILPIVLIMKCAMRKDIVMKNRQGTHLPVSGIVFLLMITFLFTGCGKTDSGRARQPKEETSMGTTALKMEKAPAIPPIDASAPARVETATFSLG